MKNKKIKGGIPQFIDEEEEAEFWGSHSPLDYMPEPKPQKAKARAPKDRPLTIRLDSEYRGKLEALASNYKMGSSTLARAIITNTIDRIVGRKQIAMTLDDALEDIFSNIPLNIKAEAERMISSAAVSTTDSSEALKYLMLNIDILEKVAREFWAGILRSQIGHKRYYLVPFEKKESLPMKEGANV